MLKRLRIIFTLMLVLAAVGVSAQFTTSSMSGKVEDMQKNRLSVLLSKLSMKHLEPAMGL